MTDYNDGNWHGWNGGQRPVAPLTILDVCVKSGLAECVPAENVNWHNPDIFAFRVVRAAPPKPRTIYLCEVHDTRTVFDTAMAATREALEYQHGEATVTEFVEVLK